MMGKWGKCDFKPLKQFAEKMKELEQKGFDLFATKVAEEMGDRLLKIVRERTPVGQAPDWVDPKILQKYWADYKGGTLRDSWRVLPVEKQDGYYIITIVNDAPYASYVEYGHRQTPGRFVPQIGVSLKRSFVPGQFMLRLSVEEMEQKTPEWVKNKLRTFLGVTLGHG